MDYFAQAMKQALFYSKSLFSEAFQDHCLSFSVFQLLLAHVNDIVLYNTQKTIRRVDGI